MRFVTWCTLSDKNWTPISSFQITIARMKSLFFYKATPVNLTCPWPRETPYWAWNAAKIYMSVSECREVLRPSYHWPSSCGGEVVLAEVCVCVCVVELKIKDRLSSASLLADHNTSFIFNWEPSMWLTPNLFHLNRQFDVPRKDVPVCRRRLLSTRNTYERFHFIYFLRYLPDYSYKYWFIGLSVLKMIFVYIILT